MKPLPDRVSKWKNNFLSRKNFDTLPLDEMYLRANSTTLYMVGCSFNKVTMVF